MQSSVRRRECADSRSGSRLDEQKRGGDIDLLLVCPEHLYISILENKFRIKSELEFVVGEQRVDLTLATPQKLESDLFLKTIKTNAVELKLRAVHTILKSFVA